MPQIMVPYDDEQELVYTMTEDGKLYVAYAQHYQSVRRIFKTVLATTERNGTYDLAVPSGTTDKTQIYEDARMAGIVSGGDTVYLFFQEAAQEVCENDGHGGFKVRCL